MECQLVLQTQAAPALIGKVGEPQSGRVSYGGVDAYLSRRRLKFDRGVLRAMFEEADFKREGSLGPRDFLATVSGWFHVVTKAACEAAPPPPAHRDHRYLAKRVLPQTCRPLPQAPVHRAVAPAGGAAAGGPVPQAAGRRPRAGVGG
jgi:hypothetical protein